jgi:AraC-like DNA-binding protein
MRKFVTLSDPVYYVHLPRVLVETAVALGAPREALFANTGLTAEMLLDPETRVSLLQYGFLAENALRLTGNPALGLYVGRNTGLAQMGMVGFVVQHSPTVGAALETFFRYSGFTAPGWEFDLGVDGPVATLTIIKTVDTGKYRIFAYEAILAAFDTQARALIGRPFPVIRLGFPYPEPAHAREYRARFYDVPMHFDQPACTVQFDAAVLSEVVAFADPAAAKLAERYCAQGLPSGEIQHGVVVEVRRVLESATGAPPTLAEVARALQTSTRSLRRELQNLGTSFKDILDGWRRVRAEQWMESNSMPLTQLSSMLGFSDVRSFRRAYKRWTGYAPRDFRARAQRP